MLHLYSLPNEVFVQILSPFLTRDILPLATVSHRFHALVLRILHYRLLVAASLKEYKLILECFHPASKLTEPHVFCKYLGTDGLSDKHEGEGSLYENVETAQRLGRLTSLYSRFRPEITVEERSNGFQLVPLAGKNIPSGLDCMADGADVIATEEENEIDPNDLTVRRAVHIESWEKFSQLCVVVNLVKVMPESNVLLSTVTIEDSVTRLFKNWLGQQAQPKNRDSSGDSQILWVDQGQNVGLKLRAREKKQLGQSAPILVHCDEDTAVSYDVDIEELHIRTTRVLLTLERSMQEQRNYKQAIIFTRSLG